MRRIWTSLNWPRMLWSLKGWQEMHGNNTWSQVEAFDISRQRLRDRPGNPGPLLWYWGLSIGLLGVQVKRRDAVMVKMFSSQVNVVLSQMLLQQLVFSGFPQGCCDNQGSGNKEAVEAAWLWIHRNNSSTLTAQAFTVRVRC